MKYTWAGKTAQEWSCLLPSLKTWGLVLGHKWQKKRTGFDKVFSDLYMHEHVYTHTHPTQITVIKNKIPKYFNYSFKLRYRLHSFSNVASRVAETISWAFKDTSMQLSILRREKVHLSNVSCTTLCFFFLTNPTLASHWLTISSFLWY